LLLSLLLAILAHINKRLQRLAAELIVELIIVQSNLDHSLIDTSHQQVSDVDGVIDHAQSRP
jgi:3-dehydroquinate dehydratase